jgi:hypothetical protein
MSILLEELILVLIIMWWLKKLDSKSRNAITLKFQIDLQLWKTWMMMMMATMISIGLGTVLEKI